MSSLFFHSDAQVGGRSAGVGQRLLDSSAKAIIKQSLSGLNRALQGKSSAATGSNESDGKTAAAEVATPSQSEFAAQVAKEVVKDLASRPVVMTLIVLAILTVLFLVMR